MTKLNRRPFAILMQRLLLPAICLIAVGASADDNLKPPPEAAFLSGVMKVADNWVLDHQTYEELQFPAMNGEEHPVKRGKHWRLWGDLDDSKQGPNSWNYLKPSFVKNGWTVVKDDAPDGGLSGIVHYVGNGVEAWATVDVTGTRVELQMIEIAPVPVSLTLKAPASTPEKMDPQKGDFPYLGPMPGSNFQGGSIDPDPFWVSTKGGGREMIASGSLRRSYTPPISNALFLAVYKPALAKAGWEILNESNGGDASLLGHYTKNGRNIWAYLHNDANGYSIDCADLGAADLGRDLKQSCHVALYGVLFDFNKSTLQPESDPLLQKVADLLARDATLKLEVQGHTDNVGSDAYNQTLSEARARAVVDWLTKHGTAPGRLTAKGYGKTRPVADNNSDEGRAKNRRVEIANPGCTAARGR
jgi:outer membrane protein OmpA-like peptidoglycan-associated protein